MDRCGDGLDRGRILLATECGHRGDLRIELGGCSWLRCGRIEAAKERILERILLVVGLQRCWS
jgi:hypothetical protein